MLQRRQGPPPPSLSALECDIWHLRCTQGYHGKGWACSPKKRELRKAIQISSEITKTCISTRAGAQKHATDTAAPTETGGGKRGAFGALPGMLNAAMGLGTPLSKVVLRAMRQKPLLPVPLALSSVAAA